MAVLSMVTGLAMLLGGASAARHRAGAAADFAALAAAQRAVLDPRGACAAAAGIAARNGARLVACRVGSAVVDVVVSVRLPGVLARWGSVTGHARAGPVRPAADR
jgi:secretion/DNA translocation related TadE-like protein